MKVDILGAGIAGLTAAYYTSKDKNIKLSLFDKENRLGGRLKTELFSDSYVDVGSQLISIADIETMGLIKELNISSQLQPFNSTFISAYYDGTIVPVSFSKGLYNKVTKSEQKIFDKIMKELNYLERNYYKVLSEFSEYTDMTLHDWFEKHVGDTPRIVDTILRAICFSDSKTLSALYGLTTLFVYLQNCFFLSNGMNSIIHSLNYETRDMLAVNLNTSISQVYIDDQKITGFEYTDNDGEKNHFTDSVVSAMPASELVKILPSTKLKDYLSEISYNPCTVVLLETKKRLWDKTWGLIFDRATSPISLMFDNRLKNSTLYNSEGVIGLLLPNNPELFRMDDANLFDYTLSILNDFFEIKKEDISAFHRYNWRTGLALCTPTFHHLIPKINENKINGLFLCGGYFGLPSQDSAIESGRAIASEIKKTSSEW